MMDSQEDLLEKARGLENLLRKAADRAKELAEEGHCALLEERVQRLEQENREFAGRLLELEEHNNDLIKLYVASHQLHATLDFERVLRTMLEVAINLIGAEKVAIFLVDEVAQELRAIAAEGENVEALPPIALGNGLIGTAVSSQLTSYGTGDGGPDDPLVCIPLWIHDEPLGAIAVYRLLQQKDGFTAVDQELFTLLARHASTAICSARLYSQSTRKFDTLRGLIDMLAK